MNQAEPVPLIEVLPDRKKATVLAFLNCIPDELQESIKDVATDMYEGYLDTEISIDHTHDLTLAFQHLMKEELLESHGRGRGTVYHLPGQSLPSVDQAFSQNVVSKQSHPVSSQ